MGRAGRCVLLLLQLRFLTDTAASIFHVDATRPVQAQVLTRNSAELKEPANKPLRAPVLDAGTFIVQDVLAYPAEIGQGDRSWLPSSEQSRGSDIDPQHDPRVFFSLALDFVPRGGMRGVSSADRFWSEEPGEVNLAFVAAAPDGFLLQRALRASADLAAIARLLPRQEGTSLAYFQGISLDLLDGPFLGPAPLRADVQWAQAIPRTGDLHTTDWRTNHDGFMEFNGITSLLDTVQLLPLTGQQQSRFRAWVRRYGIWLEEWRMDNAHRFDAYAKLWGCTQRAAMTQFLGNNKEHEQLCLEGREHAFKIVDADGNLLLDVPAESRAASKLESLHALTAFAAACERSQADPWQPSTAQQPSMMQAVAAKQARALLQMDLELQVVDGTPDLLLQYGFALYHAQDTLAILYSKLRLPVLARLMRELMLANPDEHATGKPLVAALRWVPLDTLEATDFVLSCAPQQVLPCSVRGRLGMRACPNAGFWHSDLGTAMIAVIAAVAAFCTCFAVACVGTHCLRCRDNRAAHSHASAPLPLCMHKSASLSSARASKTGTASAGPGAAVPRGTPTVHARLASVSAAPGSPEKQLGFDAGSVCSQGSASSRGKHASAQRSSLCDSPPEQLHSDPGSRPLGDGADTHMALPRHHPASPAPSVMTLSPSCLVHALPRRACSPQQAISYRLDSVGLYEPLSPAQHAHSTQPSPHQLSRRQLQASHRASLSALRTPLRRAQGSSACLLAASDQRALAAQAGPAVPASHHNPAFSPQPGDRLSQLQALSLHGALGPRSGQSSELGPECRRTDLPVRVRSGQPARLPPVPPQSRLRAQAQPWATQQRSRQGMAPEHCDAWVQPMAHRCQHSQAEFLPMPPRHHTAAQSLRSHDSAECLGQRAQGSARQHIVCVQYSPARTPGQRNGDDSQQ